MDCPEKEVRHPRNLIVEFTVVSFIFFRTNGDDDAAVFVVVPVVV